MALVEAMFHASAMLYIHLTYICTHIPFGKLKIKIFCIRAISVPLDSKFQVCDEVFYSNQVKLAQ